MKIKRKPSPQAIPQPCEPSLGCPGASLGFPEFSWGVNPGPVWGFLGIVVVSWAPLGLARVSCLSWTPIYYAMRGKAGATQAQAKSTT